MIPPPPTHTTILLFPFAVGDANFEEEDIATVAGLLKLFLVSHNVTVC